MDDLQPLRRIASNFAVLFLAEVACRGVSVLATLTLANRLDTDGYGRIEFAFNVVFWLVLIVRDCFETIVTREVARHPRITRALVNHVLAVKIAVAFAFYAALVLAAWLTLRDPGDLRLFATYGLLLVTTSLGLDFVFRGSERMGLVAVSLCVRTTVYCVGVFAFVRDASQIASVPLWLFAGEATGIALVWLVYARENGLPRPTFAFRFLLVMLRRGKSVALIQLCQAVLVTADLLVVGMMNPWSGVGRYGAPHRIVSAVMAFGLIFQHVIFPALSRGWRRSSESGRQLLDVAVRVLVTGFIPVAVGGTLLANSLIGDLLPSGYRDTGSLLAIGIWRTPLLSLAFLYQMALIAMNREAVGLRLLVGGAAASTPCIALSFHWFGMAGASAAVLVLGVILVVAGYGCLASEGLAPPVHHHVLRPVIGSLVMAPFCLWLRERHVLTAVFVGGLVYVSVVALLGGFRGLSGGGPTVGPPFPSSPLRRSRATREVPQPPHF